MTVERAERSTFPSMTPASAPTSGSDQRGIAACPHAAPQDQGGRALDRKATQGVLVVDDDQDIREALCELLRDEGYAAVAVANGEEALHYLKAGHVPCVILLDLMMPVMDGWEFRKRQASDPELSKIPVIVITAAGGMRAGSIAVEKVLAKPLHLEQVLDVLQEYC